MTIDISSKDSIKEWVGWWMDQEVFIREKIWYDLKEEEQVAIKESLTKEEWKEVQEKNKREQLMAAFKHFQKKGIPVTVEINGHVTDRLSQN